MISKLVNKNEKLVQRILEIIPGLLSWVVILSPLWLGLAYPPALVYLLTFITVYWCYLAMKGTVGSYLGFRRYKKEMAENWQEKLEGLEFTELPDQKDIPNSLDQMRHFILIPVYNEPQSVLRPTIEALLNQTFPTKQMTIAFTIEEKYSEKVKEDIYEVLGDRIDRFEDVLTYVHPAGIEGEAIGAAAANRTWGGKHAVEHLKKENRNLRNYIFTTIDCDHVLNEQYMARLTHLYLTSNKRDNRFYSSAVYTFNNNNWRVPAIMRNEANFVTMGTLSDWALTKDAGTKDSFACYSTSLKTLIDADFWDPSLGIDDTIYYWRAFIVRDGDYVGTSHYIPFDADAVEGRNYLDSYKSLYKQLLRWGYGVIDFPLSVKEFLVNKKIPLRKKISWTFKHLHKRILLINMAFLMTFGFGIATFINPNIKQTSFAYSLPDMMSMILTFTMMFLIPGIWLRSKMARPMPEDWPIWRKLIIFLEGPLVLVNLLTYSFIPYVDAQTRMMFGKKMKDLYHTPKVR